MSAGWRVGLGVRYFLGNFFGNCENLKVKRKGKREEEGRGRGGRREVEQKHHGRHTRLFIAGQRGREREEEDRQELTTYH